MRTTYSIKEILSLEEDVPFSQLLVELHCPRVTHISCSSEHSETAGPPQGKSGETQSPKHGVLFDGHFGEKIW